MIKVTGQHAPSIPLAGLGRVKASPPPLSAKATLALGEARDVAQLRLDLAAQRKANARQAVQRLKDQIAKLTPLAIIDAKATARLVHGLTRKLADAAEGYRGAGDHKDLAAAADEVESRARTIEGRAVEGRAEEPADPAAALDTATKAYLAAESEQLADENFAAEIAALRKLLEEMFKAAAERAAALAPANPEIAELIESFEAERGRLLEAEETILGWWSAAPSPALPAGRPVDVTA